MESYQFINADAKFNPIKDGDPLESESLYIGSAEYDDGSYVAVCVWYCQVVDQCVQALIS